MEKKSSGWAAIRPQLKGWSHAALLALIKDLYDSSADNRDFLLARFHAEEAGGAALEKYRTRIVEQFFPKKGEAKLRLGEARKAIRDYQKATGNTIGTIDLMLAYVEDGTEFTRLYGDINSAYYNSLASVLGEMVPLLMDQDAAVYHTFRERILRLESWADKIAWGYGDYVCEQVGQLEGQFCDEAE